MPVPGGAGGGSVAANQFPSTSPQNAAVYLNANFNNGAPVAAFNLPGSTLGAQWLAWYGIANGKFGSKYTLAQYEEAFIVLWEEAQTGQLIATGTTVGLGTAGLAVDTGIGGALSSLGKGISSFVSGAAAGTQGSATGSGVFTEGQAITDFLGRLTSASTWLRIAEGILGIVLIAIGLARITHAVPVATKIAKTAGAVAVL